MADRQALHTAHRDRQNRIADRVAQSLAGFLELLPNASPESSDQYVSRAVPVVQGGQRAAAALAAGYIRALVGPGANKPPDLDLKDLLVTAATGWVASPVIRVRAKLAEDLPWTEAIVAAQSYAGELSSGDLQVAQRFGLTAAADVSGTKIVGWRKELSADACEWCRLVSGEGHDSPRRYHNPDGLPFHRNDRCGVAPILDGEAWHV